MPDSTTTIPEVERLRLHYLDGLRGLAALYVVLHHAYMEIAGVPGWLPSSIGKYTRWAGNGRVGVQIFIALSGYCLMLPVVRSGQLKGGIVGFTLRRARRVLPPYYAALALSLAVIAWVPGMNEAHELRWDEALPALRWDVIGAHLLLLQDLKVGWIYKVNQAMWTLAQEWQLYFLFALILLPLWRRAGMVATVVFALAASAILRKQPWYDLSFVATDFLFLFAIGMFAAAINFSAPSTWLAWARDRISWGWLTLLCWIVYAILVVRLNDIARVTSFDFGVLMGGVMLSTLVYCTELSRARVRRWPLLILEAEAAVALGAFSYSLYLVHLPILSMFTLWQRQSQHTGGVAFLIEFIVAVPIVIFTAFGCHVLIERPFMLDRPKHVKRSRTTAVLDAAP